MAKLDPPERKAKLTASPKVVKAEQQRLEHVTEYLRTLPVSDRANAIIAMHAWCVREFATMVLEQTGQPKAKRRRRRA